MKLDFKKLFFIFAITLLENAIAAPPVLQYPTNLFQVQVNTSVSISPSVLSGGPLSECFVFEPELPAGLQINNNCVISGSPEVATPSTTYTVIAMKANGEWDDALVSIQTLNGIPSLSYIGSGGTTGYVNSSMLVIPTELNDHGSPISSCTTDPLLPFGLLIDNTNCQISGVPTEVTYFPITFTVIVSNSVGTTSKTVTLEVLPSPPSLSYENSAGKIGTINKPMSVTPSAFSSNGVPVTSCTTSPILPANLEINNSTCVISGTPTSLSSAVYDVTAENSAGSTTVSVSLSVIPDVPSISFNGVTGSGTAGQLITPIIPSEVDGGGGSITSCTSNPPLPSGLSINQNNCVITGTPASPSTETYNITVTNNANLTDSDSVTITIGSGIPSLSYAGATGTTGKVNAPLNVAPTTLDGNGAPIANCVSSPALPHNLSIDPVTCIISGVPSGTFNQVFNVTATNSNNQSVSSTVGLVVTPGNPTISYSGVNGDGTVNQSLSISPSELNGRGAEITSCTIQPSLPSGLSLNLLNCTISGIPLQPISEDYIITATNEANLTGTASLSMDISAGIPVLSYSGASGTSGTVGSSMSISPTQIQNNGSPISCSASSLPEGLSVDPQSCVISGTPLVANGTQTYSITATNSAGSTSAQVELSILAGLPILSYQYSAGVNGTVGQSLLVEPTQFNTNGSDLTSCETDPMLPVGLVISQVDCKISGIPLEAVIPSTTYNVWATNSAGTTVANVTLLINPGMPVLSYVGAVGTSGVIDQAMDIDPVQLSGNGGEVTCSLDTSSPDLPAGLNLILSTCKIIGVPTVVSSEKIYKIKASNVTGFVTAEVSLIVSAAVPEISYSNSTGTSGIVGSQMSVVPSLLDDNGSSISTCVSNPSLPQGLELNSSCVISGIPQNAQTNTSYLITATNDIGSTSASVSISIANNVSPPEISFQGVTGNNGQVGSMVSFVPSTLEANGAPITSCTSNPVLPSGLIINQTTCEISGIPLEVSSNQYTITAENSEGSDFDTVSISITVGNPTISYPSGGPFNGVVGQSISIPLPIVQGNGAPITNCSSYPALPLGLSLNSVSCEITGNPQVVANGPYTITVTNDSNLSGNTTINLNISIGNPSLSYLLSGGNVGSVGVNMNVAPTILEGNGSPIANCEISPSLPAGLNLNQTTCVINGIPEVVLGSTTFNVTVTNAAELSSTSPITLEILAGTPLIAYNSSYSGVFGTQLPTISPTTFNEMGGDIVCSIAPALPSDLTLNTSTCVISGIPDAVLPSEIFTVTANNGSQSASASFSLSISAGVPAIAYNPSYAGVYGSPIQDITPTTFNEMGGDITCSIAPALPAGLNLNASTCVISGIPETVLSSTLFEVTANNGTESSTASFNLSISAGVPVIAYNASYTGVLGTPIQDITPTTFNEMGGDIACSVSPALPEGLLLNPSTCVISGTPEVVLSLTLFEVTANNGTESSTTSFNLSISAGVPVIAYNASYSGVFESPIEDITPTTFNEMGGDIVCSIAPALPEGLLLNASTCVISGTPEVVLSSSAFTITANNGTESSTASFNLSISAGVPVIAYNASYSGVFESPIEDITPTTFNEMGGDIVCSIAPALPEGLLLNASTCVISGTPEVVLSSTSFTVTANNGTESSTALFNLSISAGVPVIAYNASYSGVYGSPIQNISPTTFNEMGGDIVCSISPALPSGLSLNTSTCVISGITEEIISSTLFTVTADNGPSLSSASFNLSIVTGAPDIAYSGPVIGTYGTPLSISPSILELAGGNASCSVTPALPQGLILNSSSCVISGTPLEVKSAEIYTITLTNGSGQNDSAELTLAVNVGVPTLSFASSHTGIYGQMVSVQPTSLNPMGGTASCSISPSPVNGLNFNASTCSLNGIPNATLPLTNYTVILSNGGNQTTSASFSLKIDVGTPSLSYSSPVAGIYGTNLNINPVNFNVAGGTASCEISPSLPAGLYLDQSTCSVSGIPLAVQALTQYNVVLTNAPSSSVSAAFSLSIDMGVPVISYNGPFTGVYNTPIDPIIPAILEGMGGVISCTITPDLPEGLNFNTSNCSLSGTPLETVNTVFTVTASNGPQSAQASFNLTITPSQPLLAYAGPYVGMYQTPIEINPNSINGSGGIITCTLAPNSPSLPTGLILNSSTCAISGSTSTVFSSQVFSIVANNGSTSVVASFALAVTPAMPALLYLPSYAGVVGQQINTISPVEMNEAGGDILCSISSSSSLPQGLNLNQDNCEITGTPQVSASNHVVTIIADNGSYATSASFTLSISAGVPVIAYNASYSGVFGTPIQNITPTNFNEMGGDIVCSIAPALPADLVLNTATCVISGTPQAVLSSSVFEVTANNGTASSSTSFSLSISAGVPVISYQSLYGGVVGTSIQSISPVQFNEMGGDIVCSIAPALPAGLLLNASTCVISGTPESSLTLSEFTVTADNGTESSTASFNLSISAGVPVIAYNASYSGVFGSPIQNITPTTFNEMGGDIVCSITPALPADLVLNSSTCVISGTPEAVLSSSAFTVTANNGTESSTASFNLSISAGVPVIAYNASYSGVFGSPIQNITPITFNEMGGDIVCSIAPALPAGLNLNGSTCVISGTPEAVLSSGAFTITANNGTESSTASFNLSISAGVPVIAYNASYSGVFGSPIQNITPTNFNEMGGDIVCSIASALPAGLLLNASTCVISGTPEAVLSSGAFTITANNGTESSTASFNLSISAGLPVIAYNASYSGVFGSPIQNISPTTFNEMGGDIVCSIAPALPAGLLLNASTCVISGTPEVVLSLSAFTITANNGTESSTASFNLSIAAGVPVIAYNASYSGVFGSPLQNISPTTFNEMGGDIVCSIAPALPAGLNLNGSTCVISGTPQAVLSSSAFTVTANNGTESSTASFNLSISAGVPVIAYNASYSGVFGSPIQNITPTTFNEMGGDIVCSIAPALPAGLLLNASTCVISGTPEAVLSSKAFTITADNGPQTASASFNLSISAGVPVIAYNAAYSGVFGSPIQNISPTTFYEMGGDIVCAVSPALPAGLNLNASTCVISGVPQAVLSSSAFTVTANNGTASSSALFNLSISPGVPVIAYNASYSGVYGSPIQNISPTTFNEMGGDIVCSIAPALPADLVLNSSTCVISGTPQAVLSSRAFTITANNGTESSTASFNLSISAGVPVIAYNASYSGVYGSPIQNITPTTFNEMGGDIECSIAPALPADLVLNSSTCVISGTPQAVVSSSAFTVTANNGTELSTASFNLSIAAGVPVIAYNASYSGVYGSPIQNITPTNFNEMGGDIVCSIAPALPEGLNLNASTCVISGTPEVVLASGEFTVTANNGTASSSTSFNLSISAGVPVIAYNASYSGVFGTPIQNISPTTFNEMGGDIVCSITPALPVGLNLNASTCVISGTPEAVLSSKAFTITANNGTESSTASFNLSISAGVPVIAYNASYSGVYGSPIQNISPTTFNEMGGDIVCAVSPALPAGLLLNASTCVINGTPEAVLSSGAFTITANNGTESSTASFNLSISAGVPVIAYNASYSGVFGSPLQNISPTTFNEMGGDIVCSIAPALPADLVLNSSTCVISGTPQAVLSSSAFTITANNGTQSSTTSFNLSIAAGVPVIAYNASYSGVFGSPLQNISPTTFNEMGGDIVCSIAPALPAGLNLNGSTCVISGTPEVVLSSSAFTVTANNGTESSTASFNLSISAGVPVIAYNASYSGVFGSPIQNITPTTFKEMGGDIVCSIAPALPAGLALNSSTCMISGTPEVVLSSSAFTITANNGTESSSTSFNLSISAGVPVIAYNASYSGVFGSPIQNITPTTFKEMGGDIVCSIAPALPAGLLLNASTCVISGTPEAVLSSSAFTVTANNGTESSTASFNLSIAAGVPVLSYSSPVTAVYGQDIEILPLSINAMGGAINCSVSPNLPSGLSLNSQNCQVNGRPNVVVSSQNYLIKLNNGLHITEANINLKVDGGVPVLSYAGPYLAKVGTSVTILPSQFNGMGAPTACEISPSLPAGLQLNAQNCQITGTSSEVRNSITYTVTLSNGFHEVSESFVLKVDPDVPKINYLLSGNTNGFYNSFMQISPTEIHDNGSAITECSIYPALPIGLTIGNSDCIISGIPTEIINPAKTYSIVAKNAVGNSLATSLTISIMPVLPTLTYPAGIQVGKVNSSMLISATLDGGGVNATCSMVTALPQGLELNQTNCSISGIPLVVSNGTIYQVKVTNVVGQIIRDVSIQVKPDVPTLSYNGVTNTHGRVTVPFNVAPTEFNQNGAQVSCSVVPALPDGLVIDNTCKISGTPQWMAPQTEYTVTATNLAGSTMAKVTLRVDALMPTLSYNPNQYSFSQGSAVNIEATMDSGGDYVHCVLNSSSPNLPAGFELRKDNCNIIGTAQEFSPLQTYLIDISNSTGTVSGVELRIEVKLCPVNYIEVPANLSLGINKNFCVAKYESRYEFINGVHHYAVSTPKGTPHLSSGVNAKKWCKSLGEDFDLMSNVEAMTIARNIENVSSNWSGGVVGSGLINRGHSDFHPPWPCDALKENVGGATDAYGSCADSGTDFDQKRTHTLSNEEVIWDFAGNVWEVTDWSMEESFQPGPTNCLADKKELNEVGCFSLAAEDYMPANPANIAFKNYNSSFGLGRFWGGLGGAARRGGDYMAQLEKDRPDRGIFALNLIVSPTTTASNTGYRCVKRPQ